MAGVATVVHNLEAKVLGGDLTRSEQYIVDVCVIGEAQRPVRRWGAREGDGLWVTGYLGVQRWHSSISARQEHVHRVAQPLCLPEPRIQAGMWLADHGASAMIDISDGLAADAQHLAAASEVGLEINLEQIPCWRMWRRWPRSPAVKIRVTMHHAPTFGDASVSTFRSQTGLQLTRIGTCLRGAGGRRGGVRLLDHNKPVPCLQIRSLR